MSRLADALRRAQEEKPATGSELPDSRGKLSLFARSDETVTSPWKLHPDRLQSEAIGGRSEVQETVAAFDEGRSSAASDSAPRLVTSAEAPGVVIEQYRRIAMALHQAQVERDVRTVMITSSLPGEGKTVTAANLALTISGSFNRRVLLVDCDLQSPSLHSLMRVGNSSGLLNGLQSDRPLPVKRISQNLWLLPSGQASFDPMGALSSALFPRLVEEAREAFDWVIVDTPPVGLTSEAKLLASILDTTLLVIAAGRTAYNVVQRSIETIGAERILGTVLNKVGPEGVAHPYEDYGYYGRYRARQ
jgi:protein-tyrosine kinase